MLLHKGRFKSLLSVLLLAPSLGWASGPNGFDISNATVPGPEILRGGPPRDGIPALDTPAFVVAAEASWRDADRVVGVSFNGEARAYPLRLLVWHELINDTLGGRPIVVSYCPLCGSALVFDRQLEAAPGRVARLLRFGVSGLLYRSDLLMFDRETDSLWSQIGAHAISGPLRDTRLELVSSRLEPWSRWRERHPQTTVVSARTGHARDYERTPYRGYSKSSDLYFPAPVDARYHPKLRTLGVRTRDGRARAYPLDELIKAGGSIEDRFAGSTLRITVEHESGSFDVDAPAGIDVIETYWFAWLAFHPDSSVFRAGR